MGCTSTKSMARQAEADGFEQVSRSSGRWSSPIKGDGSSDAEKENLEKDNKAVLRSSTIGTLQYDPLSEKKKAMIPSGKGWAKEKKKKKKKQYSVSDGDALSGPVFDVCVVETKEQEGKELEQQQPAGKSVFSQDHGDEVEQQPARKIVFSQDESEDGISHKGGVGMIVEKIAPGDGGRFKGVDEESTVGVIGETIDLSELMKDLDECDDNDGATLGVVNEGVDKSDTVMTGPPSLGTERKKTMVHQVVQPEQTHSLENRLDESQSVFEKSRNENGESGGQVDWKQGTGENVASIRKDTNGTSEGVSADVERGDEVHGGTGDGTTNDVGRGRTSEVVGGGISSGRALISTGLHDQNVRSAPAEGGSYTEEGAAVVQFNGFVAVKLEVNKEEEEVEEAEDGLGKETLEGTIEERERGRNDRTKGLVASRREAVIRALKALDIPLGAPGSEPGNGEQAGDSSGSLKAERRSRKLEILAERHANAGERPSRTSLILSKLEKSSQVANLVTTLRRDGTSAASASASASASSGASFSPIQQQKSELTHDRPLAMAVVSSPPVVLRSPAQQFPLNEMENMSRVDSPVTPQAELSPGSSSLSTDSTALSSPVATTEDSGASPSLTGAVQQPSPGTAMANKSSSATPSGSSSTSRRRWPPSPHRFNSLPHSVPGSAKIPPDVIAVPVDESSSRNRNSPTQQQQQQQEQQQQQQEQQQQQQQHARHEVDTTNLSVAAVRANLKQKEKESAKLGVELLPIPSRTPSAMSTSSGFSPGLSPLPVRVPLSMQQSYIQQNYTQQNYKNSSSSTNSFSVSEAGGKKSRPPLAPSSTNKVQHGMSSPPKEKKRQPEERKKEIEVGEEGENKGSVDANMRNGTVLSTASLKYEEARPIQLSDLLQSSYPTPDMATKDARGGYGRSPDMYVSDEAGSCGFLTPPESPMHPEILASFTEVVAEISAEDWMRSRRMEGGRSGDGNGGSPTHSGNSSVGGNGGNVRMTITNGTRSPSLTSDLVSLGALDGEGWGAVAGGRRGGGREGKVNGDGDLKTSDGEEDLMNQGSQLRPSSETDREGFDYPEKGSSVLSAEGSFESILDRDVNAERGKTGAGVESSVDERVMSSSPSLSAWAKLAPGDKSWVRKRPKKKGGKVEQLIKQLEQARQAAAEEAAAAAAKEKADAYLNECRLHVTGSEGGFSSNGDEEQTMSDEDGDGDGDGIARGGGKVTTTTKTTGKTSKNLLIWDSFEEKCPPNGEDRVVLYTTKLRAVRKTFEECNFVRSLLENLQVPLDERDISFTEEFREELRALMGRLIPVPRVFIRGRYIGGTEEIRLLNDDNRLDELLDGFEGMSIGPCEGCGDLRFVLCPECSGSLRVVIDDDVERCVQCNENGMVRCPVCV